MTHPKPLTLASCCTALLCLTLTTTFGQETSKGVGLKLYINYDRIATENSGFVDGTNQVSYIEDRKDARIAFFTPSLIFTRSNGNFQEIELSQLTISQSDRSILTGTSNSQTLTGSKRTDIAMALRYEYNVNLRKKRNEAQLIPYLGMAISPYFSHVSVTPKSDYVFPTQLQTFGATASIIPRITYQITSKLFLDFNAPIHLANVNMRTHRVDNPAFPSPSRTSSSSEFKAFPNRLSFRLGIGLKI